MKFHLVCVECQRTVPIVEEIDGKYYCKICAEKLRQGGEPYMCTAAQVVVPMAVEK